MWKRFAGLTRRQPQPQLTITQEPMLPGDMRRYQIAEVEMMGNIGVVTFTVDEISLEQGVALLADLLDDLVASGVYHLVLDIQNVRHMDSACVGTMVETLNKLANAGGRIALANAGNSIANLFRLTRLDRVFPICGDVIQAVSAIERGMVEA